MIELIKEELKNAEILFEAATYADNFTQCAVQNAKIKLLENLIKNHGVSHHVSECTCINEPTHNFDKKLCSKCNGKI